MLTKIKNGWQYKDFLQVIQTEKLVAREFGGRTEHVTHYGSAIVIHDESPIHIPVTNPNEPNIKSDFISIVKTHLTLAQLGCYEKIIRPHEASIEVLKQVLYDFGLNPTHEHRDFTPIVFNSGEWSYRDDIYEYRVERKYQSGWLTKVIRTVNPYLLPTTQLTDATKFISEEQTRIVFNVLAYPITPYDAIGLSKRTLVK